MDVRVRDLAARQDDLVATWQLLSAGLSADAIRHAALAGRWRAIHDGVHAVAHAPLTSRQRLRAATLTAPATVLSHGSAALHQGLAVVPAPGVVVVTRQGSGGPRRTGPLVVHRSLLIREEWASWQGIPATTVARTLLDLAPRLHPDRLAKAMRDAIRLGIVTPAQLLAAADRHRGRRGVATYRRLAADYSALRLDRTRSDAEARALEVLAAAGVPMPEVNAVVAGLEADLVWREQRLIVEIDGPAYHRLADADRRRDRRWREAGYSVRRIRSPDVFEHPDRLVTLARRTSIERGGRP